MGTKSGNESGRHGCMKSDAKPQAGKRISVVGVSCLHTSHQIEPVTQGCRMVRFTR